MRIIVFGIGNIYKRYRRYLSKAEIVAYVDNSDEKEDILIDGVRVYKPCHIHEFQYDRIYILSNCTSEMEKQLLSLGIPKDDIYYTYDLVDIYDYKPQIPKFVSDVVKYDATSIVFLSDDLKLSGAQYLLLDAAICAKNCGMNVVVASPDHGKLEQCFQKENIPVVIDERIAIAKISDLEWINGFDLVWVNTITFFGLLMKRNFNKPTIWWVHEPEVFFRNVAYEKMKEIDISNLYVCAVSYHTKKTMLRYGPSGLTPEILTAGMEDYASNFEGKKQSEKMNIIMVGELCDLKGQKILCDALCLLPANEIRNVHVNIVGRIQTGYDISFLSPLMDQGIVDLYEEIPREAVLDLYNKSDVVVCASIEESLSLASIEGMVLGIPPIVSRTTGIADYLTDGVDSFMFDYNKPDELAEKIRICITNRNNLAKLGENARVTYENHFSVNIFQTRLRGILREILMKSPNKKREYKK